MSDQKISALPSATTPLAGTEVLPTVQSSTMGKYAVISLIAPVANTFIAAGNLGV